MTVYAKGVQAWPVLVPIIAASMVLGCGDVNTFKLSPGDSGEGEPWQPAADWGRVIVELKHVADGCETLDEGPRALVGDDMEFHNCARTLVESCGAYSHVPLAIDVQPRSIIYDFSNIPEAGAFEPAEFNGYVLVDVLGLAPSIAAARIDRERTTLGLDDLDIVIEDGSIHVNFAGLDFDDTDFVKIDLEFEDMGSP